jgi:hypothetical protein
MKTLAILFTLFYFLNALAVAPYGIKGQNQSVTYPNVYQYPNYSVTGLGGINALIETGNKNILENPSFEAPFFGSAPPSWTSLGMTFNTSALPLSGQKAVRVSMSSSAMAFAQDSGVSQAAFAGGIQCLAMVYVKTTVSGIFVSSRQNSVTSTTNRVAVNNDGKYGLYKVPFICGSGSNGISIHSNGVTVTGDVDIDDAFVGVTDIAQIYSAIGPITNYTPVVTPFSGTLTNYSATGNWHQEGEYLAGEAKITFTGAAGTWLEPSVSLPSGFTINGSKIIAGYSIGSAAVFDAGVRVYGTSMVLANGSDKVTAYPEAVTTHTGVVPTGNSTYAQNFPISFGSGDTIEYRFKIPVTQFSGSVSTYSTPMLTNADRIGEIIHTTNSVAPQGFISALNKSIGQTGSGATYTGQTYFALYEHLWSIAGLTTTAGDVYRISSTKGASASADFAANKTITIDYETNAPFIRGKASAAGVGAYTADTFQDHTHLIPYAVSDAGSLNMWRASAVTGTGLALSGNIIPALGAEAASRSTSIGGTPRIGAESKPKNVSLNIFIRFAGDTQLITGQFNGLQTCTDTLSCTDTFSASIDSSGNVSQENVNWLNGNCGTATSGVNTDYTCGYVTSLVTQPMNCVTVDSSSNTSPNATRVFTSSSTQFQASNLIGRGIRVICQKQGADYIGKTAMAVASDQNVRTPGVTNVGVHAFQISSACGLTKSSLSGATTTGTATATSNCTINFPANTWSDIYYCGGNSTWSGTQDNYLVTGSLSTSSYVFYVRYNGTTGSNAAAWIQCMGVLK